MKLWKTTIVMWTDKDPSDIGEIETLIRKALWSRQKSKPVQGLEKDPDWNGNEFFFDGE